MTMLGACWGWPKKSRKLMTYLSPVPDCDAALPQTVLPASEPDTSMERESMVSSDTESWPGAWSEDVWP